MALPNEIGRTPLRRALVTIACWLIGLLFALPLLFMLTSSLRPGRDILVDISKLSVHTFIPRTWTLSNYSTLFNGNFGRNALTGPRLTNVDLALLKSVKFAEDKSVQVRAEVFNVANHPNFGLPGGAVFSQGAVAGTGNVVEDSCGVVAKHPDFYIFGPWGGNDPFLDTFLGGIGQWPQSSCHRESGWQTNVKGLATYNVPKIDGSTALQSSRAASLTWRISLKVRSSTGLAVKRLPLKWRIVSRPTLLAATGASGLPVESKR